MKNVITYLYFIVGLVVSAVIAACEPQEATDNGSYNVVNFNVSTDYMNSPSTRTVYSGVIVNDGADSYEHIYWKRGDQIRIYCPQAGGDVTYSDLLVEVPTEESGGSEAVVSTRNPLRWGSGVHSFFGLYPAPEAYDADAGIALSENVATLVLPSDQTSINRGYFQGAYSNLMQYAYMGAGTTASEEDSGNLGVSLVFRPLVNTFSIHLNAPDNKFKGVSLTLSAMDESINLAGTYMVTLADDGTYTVGTVSNGSSSITVNPQYNTLTHDGFQCLIFTIPQSITSGLRLTLKTRYNQTEYTKVLDLKDGDSWIEFEKGQKFTITTTVPLP